MAAGWPAVRRGLESADRIIDYLQEFDSDNVVGTSTVAQVRDALEGLGYQTAEIREVMASIEPEAPVAEQLRQALRSLGRR